MLSAAVSPPLDYSSLSYDATLWSDCEYPKVTTLIIMPGAASCHPHPAGPLPWFHV